MLTLKSVRKKIWSLIAERRDILVGIVLVIAAGLTLEVFAAGVAHAVDKLLDGGSVPAVHWWFMGGCFAVMLLLSLLLWVGEHVFRSLHVRYKINSEEMPKPYLVIFLSRQKLVGDISQIPETGPMEIPGGTLQRLNLVEDADYIDQTQATPCSWAVILRGIAPHLSKLRRIYLVGSKESRGQKGLEPGTFAQREMVRRFLAPYLMAAGKAATPSAAENMIALWPEPVDFENFEEVHDSLESIRDSLEEERSEEVELCVDITGGQKPTSAAAGLFTVNNEVVIQYVQTNYPKSAQMYDVRLLEWPKKPE